MCVWIVNNDACEADACISIAQTGDWEVDMIVSISEFDSDLWVIDKRCCYGERDFGGFAGASDGYVGVCRTAKDYCNGGVDICSWCIGDGKVRTQWCCFSMSWALVIWHAKVDCCRLVER